MPHSGTTITRRGHSAGMLTIDHVGLAVRNLDQARDLLGGYGLTFHEEHDAGWVPVGPSHYIHVLPGNPEGSFFRRQVARLLDADQRWSSWAVTAPIDELRKLPVGASLPAPAKMRLGELDYLTNDSGLDGMVETNGFLPYATAYFTPGLTTNGIVDALRGGGDDGKGDSIAWIEIAGEEDRLRTWIGSDSAFEARIVGGPPGIHSVGLKLAGEIVELNFGRLRANPR